jgi:hypothetical protein
MILLWYLCLCLVLAGLALLCRARPALENLWLHLFGVRVRVARPRPPVAPPVSRLPPSRSDHWPTPRVETRPGP